MKKKLLATGLLITLSSLAYGQTRPTPGPVGRRVPVVVTGGDGDYGPGTGPRADVGDEEPEARADLARRRRERGDARERRVCEAGREGARPANGTLA